MNSLRNYFTSPIKTVSNIDNTTMESYNTPDTEFISSIPVPRIKKTKTDARKIIKNMEEVLNSVKKKHKNKHKHRHHQHHHRKKDTHSQKSPTSQESNDISVILNEDNQQIVKPSIEKISTVNNVLQNLVSPSKENILNRGKKNKQAKNLNNSHKLGAKKFNKHSVAQEKKSKLNIQQSKPTKNSLSEVNEVLLIAEAKIPVVDTDEKNTSEIIVEEQQTKKNAFEFMMNARNKSFGRNSPGKSEILVDNIENENIKSVKTKRKLFLEEWADQKGAKKRKLNEEARGEFVENLLTKRAKRLKKMIVNGNQNTNIILPKTQIRSMTTKTFKADLSREKEKEKEKEKKKSIKCISSESENSSGENVIKQDIEFVSKLSSPIKKRDSLLGYFDKTISPNTNDNTDKTSITKPSKLKTENNINIEISDAGSVKTRPRRSCVGKNRYDYDLNVSLAILDKNNDQIESKPKKYVKLKKIKAKHVEENDEHDVICLDNSICVSGKSNESIKTDLIPKKLAPLFIKTIPKPNIDPKILEARQAFLMSGVPEKLKQEIAKQKKYEEAFEISIEIFPKICHVPQWENDKIENIIWENCGIIWISDELHEKSFQLQTKRRQSSTKCKSISECFRKILNNGPTELLPLNSLPQMKNKITLIKSWKNLYEKFPTYKCYNQLREKYRFFSAMDTDLDTQQIAESFVVTKHMRSHRQPKLNKNDDTDELPPDSAPNGELLFTEKYKPMSSEQILINLTPVNTLKEFLSSWQDDRRNQVLNDSMDYFACSNDSNSSINGSNISNAIVLLGPTSSGKTQAVFALANELNFNILEINAGMKRTGKKLLQELQEATQSHQIRKDLKDNLFKKSLNTKKMDINLDNSSSSELSCSGKMSLILVEDADITFDQYDAGYVDAIYQLASISKRPVVIMANNRNCSYLQRLINLNSIEFSAPNTLNISKFLTILSLIENCPIDLDEIISLYLFNNMDMRKTILEMQFFIQSGGDRIKSAIITNKSIKSQNEKYYASPTKRRLSSESYKGKDECVLRDDKNYDENTIYIHNTLFELFTRSQNFDTTIPFPINLNLLWTNLNDIFKMSTNLLINNHLTSKRKNAKNINKNGLCNEMQVLNNLVTFYENVSIATCLSSKEIDDRLTLHMEEEISHLLIEDSMQNILNTKQCSYNFLPDIPKQRTNLILSTGNSTNISKSKLLDYESSLRSICRSEKHRSSLERRSTRFYHYLRNNSINMDTFSTEIFDKACYIFNNNTEINNTPSVLAELQENC